MLSLDLESIQDAQSAHNSALVDDSGDFDYLVFRWTSLLKCTSRRCGEVVTATGEGSYDYAYNYRGETIHIRILRPKTMYPAPPIINLNDEVPIEVSEPLHNSFHYIWSDIGACLNKLRIALECILDEQGIERKSDTNRYLSLDDRIRKWGDLHKDEPTSQFFLALKWLGNAGSHSQEVSQNTALDAYDLMDQLLQLLYPVNIDEIIEVRDRIIASRGAV